MSFKRINSPTEFPKGIELTRRLVSIGFKFAEIKSKVEPNIEETLVACSIEGVQGDYRALSLLTDWLDIHSERINADHLIKLVKSLNDQKVIKYWIAFSQWKKKDIRFRKLQLLFDGTRTFLTPTDNQFLLKRHGQDPRFVNTTLIIHAKLLRHRPQDIETPEALTKLNNCYRNRVLIGPSYRADLLSYLEMDPTLTPSQLARECYSSFSTAWQVKKDFDILNKVS